MARALTAGELTLLRKDGHWTKLYLGVLKPNTIYTARLDIVPTSKDRVSQIAFDTGSGTLSNVKPGMTLYVGTSAGAYDLGMCRIRKDPIAGTLYIGLTSDIDWQADCYLTVVDDFDLWAKHAVIDNSAFKMDVDVAYSDQHTNFNPVPILGPHAVLWLEGATASVNFDASASWVFDSTISGYSWSAPGSSASSGMTTSAPSITYNAAGIYRVFCMVTAANGKTTTGVRYVFVYDRANNPPATVFQLAQCVGDHDSGGWMFDLTMEAEASLTEIRDRSLVVLFAEDWYGIPLDQTKQSIGPVAGRENIVCVGRVVGESIRWDRESGLVHFTVQGAHYWLNKIKAFPIELTFATNTPATFSVMPAMTVDRNLWHILYWHSTVIETMDFYKSGDTRRVPDGKTMASMIWSQLLDIAQPRFLASPGVDRLGRLFAQVNQQMIPSANRSSIPTVMTLSDDDWQEQIELQRMIVEDVSMITLSSQNVDESGNSVTLYSLSPGHVPRRYGEPLPVDRLLATSQSESNSLAGLALGWHINQFPNVPVVFLQNNRMFDLWPHQFAALTISAGDTPRQITYNGKLIPRRIALYFDSEDSYMHPEINFEAETFEQINTDGDVPDVDDISIPPIPSILIPSLPPLFSPFPGEPSSTPDGPPLVGCLDDTKGLLYSRNFNLSNSELIWQFGNGGIDSADIANIADFFITPGGSVWVIVPPYTIYFASALGARFTKFVDFAWLSAAYPNTQFDAGSGGGRFIAGFGFNPNKPEEIAFIAGGNNFGPFVSEVNFWIGDRAGVTKKAACNNVNGYFGSLSYGSGKWVLLNEQYTFFAFWDSRLWRFTEDGSSVEYEVGISAGAALLQYMGRASTTPDFYFWNIFGAKMYLAEDNGATITLIGDNKQTGGGRGSYAIDPTGQYLVGVWDTGLKGKSSDFGTTWSGLPNLPPGGSYAFAYAGGSGVNSRWIAARGVIRYSNNAFGAESWQNKEGNINYLIPSGLSIQKIVVPGY